jgi:pimeloyl-ACP methyl ester carboxylesterase
VLYFGGNMFHLDQHGAALLPVLAACGTNVAVFDYRGYGRSPGKPTVENMQADALALFDAVNARFPGRVIVHGQSLGSFMAAHVAAARPVLATVLESTATSAEELVGGAAHRGGTGQDDARAARQEGVRCDSARRQAIPAAGKSGA